jgi:hypothetical protein
MIRMILRASCQVSDSDGDFVIVMRKLGSSDMSGRVSLVLRALLPAIK